MKMPTMENATRIAPCRKPNAASDASNTKARSQIVIPIN
jgi:hypothetical protein